MVALGFKFIIIILKEFKDSTFEEGFFPLLLIIGFLAVGFYGFVSITF